MNRLLEYALYGLGILSFLLCLACWCLVMWVVYVARFGSSFMIQDSVPQREERNFGGDQGA